MWHPVIRPISEVILKHIPLFCAVRFCWLNNQIRSFTPLLWFKTQVSIPPVSSSLITLWYSLNLAQRFGHFIASQGEAKRYNAPDWSSSKWRTCQGRSTQWRRCPQWGRHISAYLMSITNASCSCVSHSLSWQNFKSCEGRKQMALTFSLSV